MSFKKILLLVSFFLVYNVTGKNANIVKINNVEYTYSEYIRLTLRDNSFDHEYYRNKILKKCDFINHNNFLKLDDDIFELMILECDKYNLPYSIFFSLVDNESAFRSVNNSEGSGASEYMQMMPSTFEHCANELCLKGGHTRQNSIKAGAYHLYILYNEWELRANRKYTNWEWVLAQYKYGLGGLQVRDSLGVIYYNIPESGMNDIKRILDNYSN